MTLPLPSEMTATVGQILTAAAWNSNVRDGINYLLNPPIFTGYQSAAQSVPNAAFTAISIDTEVVDPYGGHSTISNTSRYTAQVAGWYLVIGQVSWSPNATGRRIGSIFINGVESGQSRNESVPTATGSSAQSCTAVGLVSLNVGDYVELRGFQSSGGALNTAVSPTTLAAIWVHA